MDDRLDAALRHQAAQKPTRPTPGAAVEFARRRIGITQRELGDSIGFTGPAINDWKKNGAPEYVRYTLAGLILERAGLERGLHPAIDDALDLLEGSYPLDLSTPLGNHPKTPHKDTKRGA